MDGIEAAAVIVMVFVGVLLLVLLADLVLPHEKSRAEREQEELEQRGQAALDALRKLGRDYGRPKNY